MCPRDTSPEAWKIYLDIQRRMSSSERLQRAFEFSAFVNALAEGALRQKYPGAGEREIFLRAARRRLGTALFRKVYGSELPDEEPTR